MFVGRKQELATLEQQFSRHRFEMTVIYGRRRIGKTALIDQFVANKKTLYFTALQRSSAINRRIPLCRTYERITPLRNANRHRSRIQRP